MPEQLIDLIRQSRRFLLTGHENPDGDCLGAQCALYHLLAGLGKDVAIVNPDPIGPSFSFLLAHTPFASAGAEERLPPFDVAVLLDCSDLGRLGALGPRIRDSGAAIAVVDHHVGAAEGDGRVAFIDPRAAATGLLIRRLHVAMGVPLSKAAAEGVFLSLIADTGWFRYSNTDAEVFDAAAELSRIGVDVAGIYDRLFRNHHRDTPLLLARMLQQSRIVLGGKLAIASVDRNTMDHAARVNFDTDLVLDPLRSLQGIEVVALLKERFDGQVKVSLRAKGDADVERIARAFGGGGHRKAAGATMSMSLQQAAQEIEQKVQDILGEAGA
ncbi:MAG: bifunctional oligoribonuclease/PAP phosphatase NrnA [Planctomycetota bacterium]